jgi:hypothetical protein
MSRLDAQLVNASPMSCNLALAFTVDVVEKLMLEKEPFCTRITSKLSNAYGEVAFRIKDIMQVVNNEWPGVGVERHFGSDLLRCIQVEFPLSETKSTRVNGVYGRAVVVTEWPVEVSTQTIVEFFGCLPLLTCTTALSISKVCYKTTCMLRCCMDMNHDKCRLRRHNRHHS